MKKLFTSIGVGILIILSPYVFSQGPEHPLANYGPVRTDTKIDTTRNMVYYEMGRKLERPQGGRKWFNRSEDNLIDTVTMAAGLMRHDVYQYNDKNQLLFVHEFIPGYPLMSYVRADYEYDEEGRVVKRISKIIYPSEAPSEKILNIRTYDYSNVQWTEKGYFFRYMIQNFEHDEIIVHGVEIELDNQDRVTFDEYIVHRNVKIEQDNQGGVKYLNLTEKEDKYVEFTDGRKYRIGANYYTYTDSSCTSFGYSQPGIWVLGMPDKWVETTDIYDNNRNIIRRIVRVSVDGINWSIWEKVDIEYIYSDAKSPLEDDGVSNDYSLATKSNTQVYAHFGGIYISTKNAATVQIFDLTGRLLKQQTVTQGENQISVPTGGFYIVKVGNETFKVLVK